MTKDIDPRWLEAWMRDKHGTLDALSVHDFKLEVMDALAVTLDAERETPGLSETLAASYGL